MVNNTTRVVPPRAAASAYAKAAPQEPAPQPKPAPRRMTGGFWLGFLLVAMALLLMLGKTAAELFTTADTATVRTQTLSTLRPTQAAPTWQSEETNYAENLPVYRHNPAVGSHTGPVVIEFIDLGCVPCRAEISRLTTLRNEYTAQARFVTKLLPDKDRPLSTEAAIFAQIAADHNKFWQFRDTVASTNQDGVAYYLSVLEGMGIPLKAIRNAISTKQEDYLKHLREDTALALELNLNTPTNVFINGYRLGQPGLPKANAESLLMQAISGDSLVGLE